MPKPVKRSISDCKTKELFGMTQTNKKRNICPHCFVRDKSLKFPLRMKILFGDLATTRQVLRPKVSR